MSTGALAILPYAINHDEKNVKRALSRYTKEEQRKILNDLWHRLFALDNEHFQWFFNTIFCGRL